MAYIPSPQQYIDMGFYMLISSALQRRVWLGGLDANPIFPNQYMLFVGPASVGKGNVMNEISWHLGKHRRKSTKLFINEEVPKKDRTFPVSADSTSFEKLVTAVCQSTQDFRIPGSSQIYAYSSLYFCLDEAESIFKHHAEDTEVFLRTAWMGGNYTRDTHKHGEQVIKNSCLNLLGGITPTALSTVAGTGLVTNGFFSRTIIVNATRNRWTEFLFKDRTPEMLQHRLDVLAHISKLAHVYGPVKLEESVIEYFREKYRTAKRVNDNPRLETYYGRKNLHILKLAMAMHFADNLTLELSQEEIERAWNLLDSIEPTMHEAFSTMGRNETLNVSKSLVSTLSRPRAFDELFMLFYEECRSQEELKTILQDLVTLGKIKVKNENGRVVYYKG